MSDHKPVARILFVSDFHLPYSSPAAIAYVLHLIPRLNLTHLIVGGDLIDAPGIAPFRVDPRVVPGLEEAVKRGRALLATLSDRLPKGTRVFLHGNHEDRITKYTQRHAPGLASLRGLQLPAIFPPSETGFTLWTDLRPYRVGPVGFTHGEIIRKSCGQSVRQEIERWGCHIVMGHSHRLGVYSFRSGSRTLMGMECGCLCNGRPHYLDYPPDWQLGMGLVTIRGQAVHMDPIPLETTFRHEGIGTW